MYCCKCVSLRLAVFFGLLALPACNDRERDSRTESYRPAQPVPPSVTVSSSTPEVRVAMFKDAPSLRVSAPLSGARIVLNGQPWRKLAPGTAVTVTFSGATLVLEGQPVQAANVRFESSIPSEALKLNDRETASALSISRGSRPGLLAIAHLNLEEYLAGVLAGEVPYDRWHPEALKAQAVVSRTFALYEIRGHSNDPYDVESTIMSQVFRGGYKNIPVLNTAISATRGQVLTSGGTLFPAYFHSTCGGETAPAAGIFPDFAGVRPLSGTVCPYCKQSPSYRWNATFSKEQIAGKLRVQFPSMGKIESIAFLDSRGQIGAPGAAPRRAASVQVRHSNGTTNMQGNAFRLAVSPKDLKSLLFGQIVDSGDSITISGGGFGHGVGMCQYGSQGMALTGQPYTSILGFYFPGATLTRMY